MRICFSWEMFRPVQQSCGSPSLSPSRRSCSWLFSTTLSSTVRCLGMLQEHHGIVWARKSWQKSSAKIYRWGPTLVWGCLQAMTTLFLVDVLLNLHCCCCFFNPSLMFILLPRTPRLVAFSQPVQPPWNTKRSGFHRSHPSVKDGRGWHLGARYCRRRLRHFSDTVMQIECDEVLFRYVSAKICSTSFQPVLNM